MKTDAPRLPELDLPDRLLLGPGPSQVHPRVLRAMATPLLGHLDPCFLDVMDGVQELLRYVFETENRLTLAVPGTGSAAMEAALANLIEPGDPVLVCVAGFFAGRMAEMAVRYGAQVQTISVPWGEAFSGQAVAEALEQRPAKLVAIVHAETSTGVLQPLEDIAAVVHEHGALFVVDAVTSLGGLPVRVDELGLDAVYSGAQKCLSATPGSSPITFGPRAVQAMQARKTPVANWYLDLGLLDKYWSADARLSPHCADQRGLCLIRKPAHGGRGRPGGALGAPPPQRRAVVGGTGSHGPRAARAT